MSEKKKGSYGTIALIERIRNRIDLAQKIFFRWIKGHAKFLIINITCGIMVYFMMIAGNLVNSYDGIWNTSRRIAGAWETSLGRGLLNYIDRVRDGVVSVPFNSVLTMIVVTVASALVMDWLSEGYKKLEYVASLLLIVNPVICCTLSYCYTSVGYGMAFLFSILSARCICSSHRVIGVFLGAGFLATSLGCYQAYFGVTCILLLLQLMKMFLKCDEVGKIVEFLLKSISAIVLGGILYVIMTNILLKKYGIGLSAYKNASEVSLGRIITMLPESVQLCYREFYRFFIKNRMETTVFDKTIFLLAGIGVLVCGCAIRHFLAIWHKNRIYAACFFGAVCLVPVACNSVILLVGSGMSTLMCMGMVAGVVLVPVVMVLMEGKNGFFLRRAGGLLMLLLLWVNILTVEKDQLALKEGKTATVQLAETVVGCLVSGGYLEDGTAVAFVGKPSGNDMFAKRAAWNSANWYAKFGDWGTTDAANNRRSWAGVLAECCGIQLNLCPSEKYEEMRQSGVFEELTIFPAEGSIRIIDGVVVVKISGAY